MTPEQLAAALEEKFDARWRKMRKSVAELIEPGAEYLEGDYRAGRRAGIKNSLSEIARIAQESVPDSELADPRDKRIAELGQLFAELKDSSIALAEEHRRQIAELELKLASAYIPEVAQRVFGEEGK